MQEINGNVNSWDLNGAFQATDPHYQMAVVVAQFAELLRNSYWAQDAELTLAQIKTDAARVATLIEDPDVTEFAQLVARAAQMAP